MKNAFKDEYSSKQILREISILRQLSEMKGNVFTIKLHDIIIPNLQLKSNFKESYTNPKVRGRKETQYSFDENAMKSNKKNRSRMMSPLSN